MRALVLTLDQRGSRTSADAVPALLEAFGEVDTVLPFERTAGDEVQGVLGDGAAVARAAELLLRSGGWNVGVGAGEVDEPLPATARAGRGTAYLAARDAVTAAKNSPWRLRVLGDGPVRPLESALWLWAAVLHRRTDRGWEVADLVDEGLTYEEVGRRLGITQSAVSQRAQAAGVVEGRRARELVEHLAVGALTFGGPAVGGLGQDAGT